MGGKNKGYPTKKHREAILNNGHCKHHRITFKLLLQQIKSIFNFK